MLLTARQAVDVVRKLSQTLSPFGIEHWGNPTLQRYSGVLVQWQASISTLCLGGDSNTFFYNIVFFGEILIPAFTYFFYNIVFFGEILIPAFTFFYNIVFFGKILIPAYTFFLQYCVFWEILIPAFTFFYNIVIFGEILIPAFTFFFTILCFFGRF